MTSAKFTRYIYLGLLVVGIAAIAIAFSTLFVPVQPIPPAQAQTAGANGGYITGYAWSDTIGWISFNGANYGVYVSPTDGATLGGYAWSDTIGWISFNSGTNGLPNDLSGCPSGTCNARLIGTNPTDPDNIIIAGWARACAGTVGGDCTGGSRDDGWDGWINLGQSVTPATPGGGGGNPFVLNGWAWGSEVVGWVSYSGSGYSVDLVLAACNDGIDNDGHGDADYPTDADCDGPDDDDEGPVAIPAGFLSANPSSVRLGSSTTISWSGLADASGCQITASPTGPGNTPHTIPDPPDASGQVVATNLQADTTFTLICTTGGTLDAVNVRVTPIPQFREI